MEPEKMLEVLGWTVVKNPMHMSCGDVGIVSSIDIYAIKGDLRFEFKKSAYSDRYVVCPDFTDVDITHAEKGALIDLCDKLSSMPKLFTEAEIMLIDCGIHRVSVTTRHVYQDDIFIYKFKEDGSGISLCPKHEEEFIYLDYKELVAIVKRLDELRR